MRGDAKFERLVSDIKKDLIEIVSQDLRNPHVGFVTITDVEVSNDLSFAKIYVSFLNENEEHESLHALNRSKGFVRSELARKLSTRRVPEISFVLDEGYKKEKRIEELLKK